MSHPTNPSPDAIGAHDAPTDPACTTAPEPRARTHRRRRPTLPRTAATALTAAVVLLAVALGASACSTDRSRATPSGGPASSESEDTSSEEIPPGPQGVTGEHTVRGVPRGVTSLTPYIGVPDAGRAAEFYRDVFGARIVETTRAKGTVIHTQLDLGDGHLHLEQPDPEDGLDGPPSDGAPTYTLGFYTQDVDAMLAKARAAGATVLTPPVEFASGDRFASIKDPYGIHWSIMSRVQDLSEAESAERIARWADQQRDD